jgi:sec-independent protein translocase protein TatB
MFGINGSEFLVLIVVAIVVIGPERLPRYSAQLGAWVRTMRGYLRAAKVRVDAELGEQAGDVDWAALDPRRYDPRRIVREALLDDLPLFSPPDRAGPARPPGLDDAPTTAAGVANSAGASNAVSAGTAARLPLGDVGAGPANAPAATAHPPRDERDLDVN